MTDVGRNSVNEANSPLFDILNIANKVGSLNTTSILNGHFYTKEEWRRIVWQTLWQHEDDDCFLLYTQPKPDNILLNVMLLNIIFSLMKYHVEKL